MSVVEAVAAAVPEDLSGWGFGTAALRAAALKLAESIDDPRPSAAMRAMCAQQLREVFDDLRALAPKGEGLDAIDDLAARRAERLAAAG